MCSGVPLTTPEGVAYKRASLLKQAAGVAGCRLRHPASAHEIVPHRGDDLFRVGFMDTVPRGVSLGNSRSTPRL